MLHGKELGRAIDLAIKMKIDLGKIRSRTDVARAFQISPQAIRGWIQTGSIAKEKIPHLWQYFSDVVGPEHWGLSPTDTAFINSAFGVIGGTEKSHLNWPFAVTKIDDILRLSPEQLQQLDLMIAAYLLGVQSNARKSEQPATGT